VVVTGRSAWGTGTDYITLTYDARTGSRHWTRRYDGPDHSTDEALALALSPDASRLFVTGYSTGLDGYQDYATIAYDAVTGSPLWTRRYSGSKNGYDEAWSIAVTPDGSRVLVTGQSDGGATSDDYATIAYDAATGATLWVQRFDGRAHSFDDARAIALSPDGSTAFVSGDATMADVSDYVTIALSTSTGAVLWRNDYSKSSGSGELFDALGVSPDGSRIFVTGSSTLDFATIAIDATTGVLAWARTYDGPAAGNDEPEAIAVSPDGTEVIVTGFSEGDSRRVDYATIAYSAATGGDIWVRRYDGLAHLDDFPKAIVASPDGAYVYVTGWAEGGTATQNDYATVAYALPNGRPIGVRLYDGPANDDDYGAAIASTATLVFVTGRSDGGTVTDYDYATVAYVI